MAEEDPGTGVPQQKEISILNEFVSTLLHGADEGETIHISKTQDDGTMRSWSLLIGRDSGGVERVVRVDEEGTFLHVPIVTDANGNKLPIAGTDDGTLVQVPLVTDSLGNKLPISGTDKGVLRVDIAGATKRFAVDTGQILTANIGVSATDLTVISLENIDAANDIFVKVTVTIDLPSAGAAFSVFRNPTEGVLTEAVAKTPLNLDFGSADPASVTCNIWNQTTPGAGIGGFTAVADGTLGPFMLGSPKVTTDKFVLGLNDLVTVQLFSGAVAYDANVSLSFFVEEPT